MNSKRIYIKDLNANDVFTFPGDNTLYTVESRHTVTARTALNLRTNLSGIRSTVILPNLSTADLIVE